MSGKQQSVSLVLLRWILGVVLIWESLRFVFSPAAAHVVSGMGLPHVTIPVLGVVEIFAAFLLLLPKFSRLGGYLLLVVLAFAIAVHLLHRQFGVGSLLVYAAAAFVCAANDR